MRFPVSNPAPVSKPFPVTGGLILSSLITVELATDVSPSVLISVLTTPCRMLPPYMLLVLHRLNYWSLLLNPLIQVDSRLVKDSHPLNSPPYTSPLLLVDLREAEVSLLSKGLKFCPTPERIDIYNVRKDIRDYVR